MWFLWESCHFPTRPWQAGLSQWIQVRPTRAFPLDFAPWSQEKNQSLGVEDLKCKTWELSASCVFYHMEEGSLQRKNEVNTGWRKNSNSTETLLQKLLGSAESLSSPHCLAPSFLGFLDYLEDKLPWFQFLSLYVSILVQPCHLFSISWPSVREGHFLFCADTWIATICFFSSHCLYPDQHSSTTQISLPMPWFLQES